LPYVTSSSVDTTTGAEVFNYDFLDVGIVLTVTPRITSNGYVTMDVSQTANDFVGYTSFNAPITNLREAQTTVSVADGETVVLGGIINNQLSETINKIPLLGDIPILGNLFRSTSKTNNKTELLVFLTPHVVRSPDDAEKLRQATESHLGKSTQDMVNDAQASEAAPDFTVTTTTPSSGVAPGSDPSPSSSPAPATGSDQSGTTTPPAATQ
jgi:general secretion pathway protein D